MLSSSSKHPCHGKGSTAPPFQMTDQSFFYFNVGIQKLEIQLQKEQRLPPEEKILFKLDRIGMWTKLRPGLRSFLAATAPLFELWVYTNGTRCAPIIIFFANFPEILVFVGLLKSRSATIFSIKGNATGLVTKIAAILCQEGDIRVMVAKTGRMLKLWWSFWIPAAPCLATVSLLQSRKGPRPQTRSSA